MKQFMKRAGVVFMVMALSFGAAQTTQGKSVQAAKNNAAKNTEAKKAYKKYLSKKVVPSDQIDHDKFALLDMNNDGISELLYTDDGGGYRVEIIAYINGKAKTIGSGFSGLQKYYPNKHIYFSQTTHTGVDEYTYYKFTGKKLKAVAKKYGELAYNAVTGKKKPDNEAGKSYKPYKYTVNGKTVSASKYQSYKKKLLSGANKAKLKWFDNTSENRDKYL